MTTVIFACVHNAGRSQMSAAFFNAMVDGAQARAISAGTRPADRIHPEVLVTMREAGIELGTAPQLLTVDLARGAEWIVTMGCGDECPYVPGLLRADWPVPDPKGQPIERVREIRDEIRERVRAFATEHGWIPSVSRKERA